MNEKELEEAREVFHHFEHLTLGNVSEDLYQAIGEVRLLLDEEVPIETKSFRHL